MDADEIQNEIVKQKVGKSASGLANKLRWHFIMISFKTIFCVNLYSSQILSRLN